MINKIVSIVKGTLSNVFRLARSPLKAFKAIKGDSLYRNSIFLMLNNIVLQATGFFFWMVAARLYSTEAVGLASAAITAMTLLTTISIFGLDYSLIRFLPNAGIKAKNMINTCFTIGGGTSIIIALIFIAGLDFWSPALVPIRQNHVFLIIFVISVVATALNTFSQQIFIAKRRADLALTRGLTFGLSRFIPLVIMASFFQSFGIFVAWGSGVLLALLISVFSIPKIEPGYYPSPGIKKEVLSTLVRFSLKNYIANLVLNSTILVLPIMVVNLIGVEQNAYFYVGWSLGCVLFMVPWSLSSSLFAEGSHNQERLSQAVTRSLKLAMLILIPAVVLMLVVGDKLLLLFGRVYSENATDLLRILAISALPYTINQIYFSTKRVKMQMSVVIILSIFLAIVVLGLSWVLLPRMGIEGVGVAWLTSQGIVALGVVINLVLRRKKENP